MFNGNLLVAKQEEILFSGSYGFTNDKNSRQPINETTVFELASVSKQFTAYATLKTINKQKEDIDRSFRHYFPKFPYQNITTRNLLNHTSGLPDYFQLFDQKWDKTKIAINQDVLELLTEFTPDAHFSPNENWEYSNTGYALLALLIEKINGISFAQTLHDEIFKPLEMNDSLVYNRRFMPQKIDNYAYGLVLNSKTNEFDLPDNIEDFNAVFYLDGIQGDGTVNSNMLDLLKWNNAILNKNILNANAIELMLTETQININQKVEYGMGLMLNNDERLGKIAFHGGSWPGYSTYSSLYLDNGISIISLCNQPKNIEIEQQLILALENIV